MDVLSIIIIPLVKLIIMLLNMYSFIVAATVILSWVNPDPYNPIVRILRQVTEPILGRIRAFLPRSFFRSGFDFSPLLLLFAIYFINDVLQRLLFVLFK